MCNLCRDFLKLTHAVNNTHGLKEMLRHTDFYEVQMSIKICMSINFPLYEVGLQRQQVLEGSPGIPVPSDTLHLALGDPEVFPEQKGNIIPPMSSGSVPGPPPS